MPNHIAILSSLLVGLAATLGTIAIHGFAVHTIVMTLRRNLQRGVLGPRIWVNLTFVMGATLIALAGHLMEITLWAFTLDICGAVADISAWTVPASRMKMGKQHDVPLSDEAVAILRAQEAVRGKNPYVFPGARPRQPLQGMPKAMRRLGAASGPLTACAALQGLVRSYQRSSMLERRRPVMQAWASFLSGEAEASKVVALNGRRKRS
jgi:hypothetical protein